MKIKPIIEKNTESYDNCRYNSNTKGICISIKSGNKREEKIESASLALVAIMYEKDYLKHELIKGSFDQAKSFVDKYEGDKTL